MTVKRTVFAADKVGFHILHTLFQTSMKFPEIHRLDEWFVTDIILDGGAAAGVIALDIRRGELARIASKAVVLATGGCGRLYEFTTNGFIKTGDGMALAYRAGVPLKDMEMVQFHPTCLPGTGILITEAARGEGGYLINKDGERFMKKYLPGKMELGPRDILSRSELIEIREGRGFSGPHGEHVGLDLRHLGEEAINERLPMVRELAEKYVGIDPAHELIPVRPGQHYIMGGVATNMKGETSVPGLYAVGECSCTGLHGANRLASNSLLEAIVFGARVAADVLATPLLPVEWRPKAERLEPVPRDRDFAVVEELRDLMSANVGVIRNGAGLAVAVRSIRRMISRTSDIEARNMLTTGLFIAAAALQRRESRGAHFRSDFPQPDPALARRSLTTLDAVLSVADEVES